MGETSEISGVQARRQVLTDALLGVGEVILRRPRKQARQRLPKPQAAAVARPAVAAPAVGATPFALPRRRADAPQAAAEPTAPAAALQIFEGDVAEALAGLAEKLASDAEAGSPRLLGEWCGGAEGPGEEGARILLVGEDLKPEAASTGRPLVPDAAALMDKAVEAMKLPAGAAWLTNVVPWVSRGAAVGARGLTPEAERLGTAYLMEQIRILRPAVLIALGARATHVLTGRRGIIDCRGEWLTFDRTSPPTPVMPTFHPSYVMKSYSLENRQKIWLDLQSARATWAQARGG